ncbi:MAG TPA: hypothetical protein VIL71_05775 [Spirillospora sp.]
MQEFTVQNVQNHDAWDAVPADDAEEEATRALQKALDRRDNGGRSLPA